MRRLALLVIFGWFIAAAIFWGALAHADPTDGMCGTGKFYNQFSNSCEPTDRGAYPNNPSGPNTNPGGGSSPGYSGDGW